MVKEKKGILKTLWDKSVFPEMIEQKRALNKMKREAKKEAIAESKDAFKEHFKQAEMDKLTKKKPGVLASLSNELKQTPIGSTDKINQLLGNTNNNDKSETPTNNVGSAEHINNMMGMGNSNNDKKEQGGLGSSEHINKIMGVSTSNKKDAEDKIKRMME